MKKILVGMAIVGVAAVVAYGAITPVASHSAPALVSEINSALGEIDTALTTQSGMTTLSNGHLVVYGSNIAATATLTIPAGALSDASVTNADLSANSITSNKFEAAVQATLTKADNARTNNSVVSAGDLGVVTLGTSNLVFDAVSANGGGTNRITLIITNGTIRDVTCTAVP